GHLELACTSATRTLDDIGYRYRWGRVAHRRGTCPPFGPGRERLLQLQGRGKRVFGRERTISNTQVAVGFPKCHRCKTDGASLLERAKVPMDDGC
ncbi:unnamed protein product, partial [Ectocarpus sp. 6 AP-2014]